MDTLDQAPGKAESGSSPVTTVNPSTGSPVMTYDETSPAEIEVILEEAHRAAALWRETSVSERADALRRFASVRREQRQELALTATREMGRPLSETLEEVTKCAWACDWFADHAPDMLERGQLDTEALDSYVVFVPLGLGVLFAIMPWNAPYWQVIRALAPALVAGNVAILKHAASTTGCALRLAEVARNSGLPAGVLSVIVVNPREDGRGERTDHQRRPRRRSDAHRVDRRRTIGRRRGRSSSQENGA